MSWNCGVEGAGSEDVDTLRERQIRNFATLLMVSQGVPMLVMGDEARRSQGGNNNAWCQDNPVAWFDWTDPARHEGMLRFWQKLIAFRRAHPTIHRSRFFTGESNARGVADVTWHGVDLGQPGWGDGGAHALGFTLGGSGDDPDIHVMANMYWGQLDMAFPVLEGRRWGRIIDTSRPSPDDIGEPVAVTGDRYAVQPRSVVVLSSS